MAYSVDMNSNQLIIVRDQEKEISGFLRQLFSVGFVHVELDSQRYQITIQPEKFLTKAIQGCSGAVRQ